MTLLADESGVQTSRPREGIEIRLPLVVYRIATGTRDITINGQRFRAGTSQREEIKLETTEDESALIIRLPMKHPVPQRWLASASPPNAIEVNVYRMQLTSGEYERVWNGYVSSIGAADNNTVATLRVPSVASTLLNLKLPTILVGRECPHILYDANCQVARASFKVSTTITSVNGRIIHVASMGANPDFWADAGEIVHTASGERMSVFTQVGTVITMKRPVVEMKIGDAVEVFAGCLHRIVEDCDGKFNNRLNFGGFPQMQSTNLISPTGLGVYTE